MNYRGKAIGDGPTVPRLFAFSVRAERLPQTLAAAMFRLFQQCYTDVSESGFRRDLEAKSHVILVVDELSRLKGFSTLVLWQHVFHERDVHLLFSGDTVIEPSAWGHPALPVAFLSAAGEFAAAHPRIPLYWLLTTKGHRTFRFMPLFFHQFYPSPYLNEGSTYAALAREAGERFFSERYDAATGVLAGKPFSGSLNPALVIVPQKDRPRADVQYFLNRNPGYAKGDELLCVAHMTPSNLRPFARRPFERGSGSVDGCHDKTTRVRCVRNGVDILWS